MLFLSKLLPVFVLPLGFAIAALLLAVVFWRAYRTARILVGCLAVLLWIASAPVVADALTAQLELEYPPLPIDQLPSADAAILLGGILAPSLGPEPDLGDPVDRIIEAWRIYRAGKVSRIVVSGGNLPWLNATEPEAALIKSFLAELGVPENSIMVDTESADTRENAVNTAAIFAAEGWHTGLLVTSGTHMPRALASFREVGLTVTPATTDTHANQAGNTVLDFLPDAEALGRTTTVLREWLGLLYYRARGWA